MTGASVKTAFSAAAAAVFAFSMTLVGTATALPTAAAISLMPPLGPPTSQVTLTGSGFGANEQIFIRFDSSSRGKGNSDVNGDFVVSITVPASALPRDHVVSAKGKTSHLVAQATFTVRTDWTQLQFTPDHLGVNPYENVISPSNVGTLQLKWATSLHQYPVGQPAVVGGITYVAGQGPRDSAYVAATDAAEGTLIWSQITKHADGAFTQALWGGFVFVSPILSYSMRAYDARTGSQIWIFNADGALNEPVISGGVLYTASNAGTLYALDAATGSELWNEAVTPLGVYDPVAVADGKVFVGAYGVAAAYDAQTGALLWSADLTWELASPTVAGGVVYVGSHGGGVYALSEADGSVLWHNEAVYYVAGAMALSGNLLYLGSSDNSVYALNAATGAVGWQHLTGDDVLSSPIVANGVVYVGSTDSMMYGFDAGLGTQLWTYQLSLGGLGDGASIADGVLYVPSYDGRLYAFGLP